MVERWIWPWQQRDQVYMIEGCTRCCFCYGVLYLVTTLHAHPSYPLQRWRTVTACKITCST
ncbi:hypothetical protein RchiOBHm_Chr5g0029751 [Rosa chinensis]|uniref:Uncharacterized protein n=1 Tax=Rosa chinensis TaxID=74649 RepID=A0A2P6Q9R5_ROSCH|nr:hypothetical protein RchiOBHm_Chr5g0029751 [Rosa chinensis]